MNKYNLEEKILIHISYSHLSLGNFKEDNQKEFFLQHYI